MAKLHPIERRRAIASLIAIASAVTLVGCKKDTPKEVAPKAEISAEKLKELSKGSDLEKTELKLGFIKLTDCAPLVIAKEMGYFEEEGLNVTLEAQANWKVLLDRVITGELDGAHMLAGQPLAEAAHFDAAGQLVGDTVDWVAEA